jgi:uncharacterized membrane protein
MSIFSIFKATPFFTDVEKEKVVSAIRTAELQTSGEIRVYVESKNPYVNTMDRAKEVFYDLKMDKTENRNAVLIYVATKHKEIAVFGDEGIYAKCGEQYWYDVMHIMISTFSKNEIVEGLKVCVHSIGEALKEKFPYMDKLDKNELPDEIVFGK